MPKATTPKAAQPELEHGTATILDRQIKVKQVKGDDILVVDMITRRMARLTESTDGDGRISEENWPQFLNTSRRLLDWLSGNIVDLADLEWLEDRILAQELEFTAVIGPLLTAMGVPDTTEAKPTNRRARRAK